MKSITIKNIAKGVAVYGIIWFVGEYSYCLGKGKTLGVLKSYGMSHEEMYNNIVNRDRKKFTTMENFRLNTIIRTADQVKKG